MRSRVLLFSAVLLAFGASATHGFHFDDFSLIHGPAWTNWQTRPLTWISFLANAEVSTQPALWHSVNLGAHLAAVLLLYELLGYFFSEEAALLGSAVFAVHPIQAETVAYVFSRATLFSTVFSLATSLLWCKNKRWWAVKCFALALLSKEDCAAVPLAIGLYEGRRIRTTWAPWLTMCSLAAVAAVRTLMVTQVVAGSGAGFTAGISPGQYALDQGLVVLRYLRLLFVPYGFTIDPDIHIQTMRAVVSWILVALLIVWAWRKNRLFLGGLILLIPSSSVFPLADLAADHRMYLPMTAFAGCIGAWLARVPRTVAIGVIVLLIGFSAQRMNVWGSEENLWAEAVDRAPGKLRARIQLSRAIEPTRALSLLTQAQATYPHALEIDEELGRVYLQLGQPALALGEFGKVLGQQPSNPHAINNRGVALRALGQDEAAKQDFHHALDIQPCFEDARRNLGLPPCGR